MGNPPKRVVY